jgi:alpha-mannosidase
MRTLTLPNNDKIRIFAISVAEENPELTQAQPLYDTLNRTEPPTAISLPAGSSMVNRR